MRTTPFIIIFCGHSNGPHAKKVNFLTWLGNLGQNCRRRLLGLWRVGGGGSGRIGGGRRRGAMPKAQMNLFGSRARGPESEASEAKQSERPKF